MYTYDGGAMKPKATVTYNGRTLYEGTSYTLSYTNNVNAGTATATATGTGNFTGTKSASFTIEPADLNYVNGSVATATYTGAAQTPRISLYTTYLDADRYTQYNYLTEGTDYTVNGWANNTNAGTASVTVTSKGNFTGTRKIDFTINPLEFRSDDLDISALATKVGDDGAELHYLTVTWKQNGRNLVQGTDFTVENLYSDYGYAYFYLRFKGNFGSSTGTISIPLTDSIGSLPASGVSGGWNWEIDANGVMTVSGMGSLSKMNSWSPYAGLVKTIVVQTSASYNHAPITAISAETFADFNNCTECTLPEGLLTVSPDAFPKNNRMIVHLPDTVTTIDFSYNSNFEYTKTLVNPGSTTEKTIRNADNYYAYFGYEGYPDFQLLDTHSEDRGLCLRRYSGNGGTVTIPDFVDSIEAYGFERHGIEKVVIPGSVKSMNAFLQNCYDLRELVIQPSNMLTELPSHFISGCSDITLYLPDNITSIGSPLNWYTNSNMLIVANCSSYAIEWAKGQMSWGSPIWSEEDGTTGPHYRLIHDLVHHDGQAATCETDGWTAYDTCKHCDYDSRTVIPALGHDWGEATYIWNDAHTQVTASHTCSRDASHMETETADATSEITTPAGCTKMGVTTYTSAAFSNAAFEVQILKLTDVPALGHSWTVDPSIAATDNTDGVRGRAYCPACGTVHPERAVSAQKVLRIPAMMQTIGEEAFAGVAAEQVTIPNGALSIGSRAFADCDSLLIAVIPASVNAIADDAFADSDVAVICPATGYAADWCGEHQIPHNP